MPRLMIIALVVAGVAARAVAAPDDRGSAAAAVDLENEQRHDVFDDALDDADALLAPDHAAGLRAEQDLMKEVLEEQKSVIDSLESTAAAEAALARDDPYLAVEPTREVEVSDERAGGGVEAAAEAAAALEASKLPAKEKRPCAKAGTIRFLDDNEPEVTDDALGPLVAKVARGPGRAAGEFEALARDVGGLALRKAQQLTKHIIITTARDTRAGAKALPHHQSHSPRRGTPEEIVP